MINSGQSSVPTSWFVWVGALLLPGFVLLQGHPWYVFNSLFISGVFHKPFIFPRLSTIFVLAPQCFLPLCCTAGRVFWCWYALPSKLRHSREAQSACMCSSVLRLVPLFCFLAFLLCHALDDVDQFFRDLWSRIIVHSQSQPAMSQSSSSSSWSSSPF